MLTVVHVKCVSSSTIKRLLEGRCLDHCYKSLLLIHPIDVNNGARVLVIRAVGLIILCIVTLDREKNREPERESRIISK